MTRRWVIASNVSGPTNRVADGVMIETTSWPRFCSLRATSTALYAPTPPVTPSATNISISFQRSALSPECSHDLLRLATRASQPGALGQHDSPQPIDRRRELVVDHQVVVLGERRDLLTRDLEPPLDRVLGVLAATAEPPLEHLVRWGQHEYRCRLDAAAANLSRALDVDHQHEIGP